MASLHNSTIFHLSNSGFQHIFSVI